MCQKYEWLNHFDICYSEATTTTNILYSVAAFDRNPFVGNKWHSDDIRFGPDNDFDIFGFPNHVDILVPDLATGFHKPVWHNQIFGSKRAWEELVVLDIGDFQLRYLRWTWALNIDRLNVLRVWYELELVRHDVRTAEYTPRLPPDDDAS